MNIEHIAKQMNNDQLNESSKSNRAHATATPKDLANGDETTEPTPTPTPTSLTNDAPLAENSIKSPTVTIMSNAARFELGQVVATPAAIALLKETGFSATMLIARHLHGDFGDICAEDAAENEISIKHGFRIMSVYRLVAPETLKTTSAAKKIDLPTIWLITEADRSSTCFLLPAEY